jgi:hypothetical protein
MGEGTSQLRRQANPGRRSNEPSIVRDKLRRASDDVGRHDDVRQAGNRGGITAVSNTSRIWPPGPLSRTNGNIFNASDPDAALLRYQNAKQHHRNYRGRRLSAMKPIALAVAEHDGGQNLPRN